MLDMARDDGDNAALLSPVAIIHSMLLDRPGGASIPPARRCCTQQVTSQKAPRRETPREWTCDISGTLRPSTVCWPEPVGRF
jgi:hypothetical protein